MTSETTDLCYVGNLGSKGDMWQNLPEWNRNVVFILFLLRCDCFMWRPNKICFAQSTPVSPLSDKKIIYTPYPPPFNVRPYTDNFGNFTRHGWLSREKGGGAGRWVAKQGDGREMGC